MLCVLYVDGGYIEINGSLIAIVPNKEDATEIEVNDFISTVKSIKESTGISDEIDMDFNDNVGKVKKCLWMISLSSVSLVVVTGALCY